MSTWRIVRTAGGPVPSTRPVSRAGRWPSRRGRSPCDAVPEGPRLGPPFAEPRQHRLAGRDPRRLEAVAAPVEVDQAASTTMPSGSSIGDRHPRSRRPGGPRPAASSPCPGASASTAQSGPSQLAHRQPGLLLDLAGQALDERLARIDDPAGRGPVERAVATSVLDEQQPAVEFDETTGDRPRTHAPQSCIDRARDARGPAWPVGPADRSLVDRSAQASRTRRTAWSRPFSSTRSARSRVGQHVLVEVRPVDPGPDLTGQLHDLGSSSRANRWKKALVVVTGRSTSVRNRAGTTPRCRPRRRRRRSRSRRSPTRTPTGDRCPTWAGTCRTLSPSTMTMSGWSTTWCSPATTS